NRLVERGDEVADIADRLRNEVRLLAYRVQLRLVLGKALAFLLHQHGHARLGVPQALRLRLDLRALLRNAYEQTIELLQALDEVLDLGLQLRYRACQQHAATYHFQRILSPRDDDWRWIATHALHRGQQACNRRTAASQRA